MYLLRHGQSQFNVTYSKTKIDPNIPDPELTSIGRNQIRTAAESLKEKEITNILVSPYTRTLQTADIVADILKIPIKIESLVHEHAFFSCDIGSTASKLSKAWPHLDFDNLNEHWWPDLDETEHQVKLRCHAFQQKMLDLGDWSKTLVVSHWAFIRSLTGKETINGEILNVNLASLDINPENKTENTLLGAD